MNDLEESAKRFGQGLVVAVCLSIAMIVLAAYFLELIRAA